MTKCCGKPGEWGGARGGRDDAAAGVEWGRADDAGASRETSSKAGCAGACGGPGEDCRSVVRGVGCGARVAGAACPRHGVSVARPVRGRGDSGADDSARTRSQASAFPPSPRVIPPPSGRGSLRCSRVTRTRMGRPGVGGRWRACARWSRPSPEPASRGSGGCLQPEGSAASEPVTTSGAQPPLPGEARRSRPGHGSRRRRPGPARPLVSG